jgi:VanZ family protein
MIDPLLRTASRLLKEWLPAILWGALIFVFSTDLFSDTHTAGVVGPHLRFLFPGISPENLDRIHFFIRKFGHFSEYFILTVLLMRALRQENAGRIERRHLLISFAIATLYAISDEFHQSFVRSRGANVIDVLIDMCGGISGIFWSHRRNRGKGLF